MRVHQHSCFGPPQVFHFFVLACRVLPQPTTEKINSCMDLYYHPGQNDHEYNGILQKHLRDVANAQKKVRNKMTTVTDMQFFLPFSLSPFFFYLSSHTSPLSSLFLHSSHSLLVCLSFWCVFGFLKMRHVVTTTTNTANCLFHGALHHRNRISLRIALGFSASPLLREESPAPRHIDALLLLRNQKCVPEECP